MTTLVLVTLAACAWLIHDSGITFGALVWSSIAASAIYFRCISEAL